MIFAVGGGMSVPKFRRLLRSALISYNSRWSTMERWISGGNVRSGPVLDIVLVELLLYELMREVE